MSSFGQWRSENDTVPVLGPALRGLACYYPTPTTMRTYLGKLCAHKGTRSSGMSGQFMTAIGRAMGMCNQRIRLVQVGSPSKHKLS